MAQSITEHSTAPIESLSHQQIEELQKHALLKDVDATSINQLLNHYPIIKLRGGETLIHAGENNHNLYLILSGCLRAHLAMNLTNPVAILEVGQSVGEVSIIDKQPASANVIADVDTELLVINEDEIWHIIDSSHAVASNMLRLLSRRLRHGNSMFSKIRDLMREYEYSAMVDPLTNLYNRRWLGDMLPRIMQRSQSDQQSLCVIMLDIDFFKQYNDQHGHLAGDCALRILSDAIKQHIRPEDFVTRYGGEEFFLLLPGQNLTATRQIAERLRIAVSETTVQHRDGRKLPALTISVGISEMNDRHTADSLIDVADQALYRAKNSGRNRVCD